MAHKIDYVTNTPSQYLPWSLAHYNMLALIRRFAMGYGSVTTPEFTGTGNGTMTDVDALPAAVSETWTVTCKTTVENGGVFSVVGSVSGAKADATVGVAYDNGKVQFKINDGETDFAVNDVFTFDSEQSDVSANGENWTELRYDTSQANHELILKGQDIGAGKEVFVGFRTYQSESGDYYNLVAMTADGYVAENIFDEQPNCALSGVPAYMNRIDYWITLNKQRIAVVMRIDNSVYEIMYVGRILAYARPDQYPYPVVCAGMLDGVPATRFSETTHSMPWRGNRANFKLRNLNGEWEQPYCYPYCNNCFNAATYALRDTGAYYHLMAVEVYKPNTCIYGTADGIYFITGFGNAVENTVVIDGITYVVFRDVWRTGFGDYFAMKMEA